MRGTEYNRMVDELAVSRKRTGRHPDALYVDAGRASRLVEELAERNDTPVIMVRGLLLAGQLQVAGCTVKVMDVLPPQAARDADHGGIVFKDLALVVRRVFGG